MALPGMMVLLQRVKINKSQLHNLNNNQPEKSPNDLCPRCHWRDFTREYRGVRQQLSPQTLIMAQAEMSTMTHV